MTDQPLPFTGDPALTCPWCGTEEPNAYVLANNHAPDTYRARRDRRCCAQDITGNHVRYYSERLAKGDEDDSSVCRCHKTYRADCCERLLTGARNRYAALTIAEAS